MTDHLHEITIRIEDFDLRQLKPEEQALEGDALRLAIRSHFEGEFKEGLGAAEIVVTEDLIILRWRSAETPPSLADQAVNFLSGGDYKRGIALLEIALRSDPDDQGALYNLGMALSDQERLDESESHLRRLLELDPSHARAWTALGVALARKRDLEGATVALREAVQLDPNDGYALRNLGAILIEDEKSHTEAGEHLRKAAEILPEDQQVWVNLGKLCERTGELDDADEAYLKVLEINPTSQMAQLAKDGRSRISEQGFRESGFRPDALMYCLGALERFDGMAPPEIQKITFEIATLGMGGINPNDPAQQYTLKSISGNFSGLHMLCIEYVGFKKLDPSVDIGFDLSQEYAEATRMHSAK